MNWPQYWVEIPSYWKILNCTAQSALTQNFQHLLKHLIESSAENKFEMVTGTL